MPSLEKNKPIDHPMHTHRRLFGYAMGVYGFLPVATLLSLLLSVVIIIQMFALSMVIATVFQSQQYPDQKWLVLLVASVILRSILIWIRERYAQKKAVQIKSAIRKQAFGKLLELGPAYTRNTPHGKIIATILEGTEKLDDYFTRYLPSLIHIAILPPAIIIFSFYLDWPSGLVLLLTGPLILFFMWLIGTYAKKISQDQWNSLSSLSSRFLDAIQGLKTLKLLGASEEESARIAASSNQFRVITMGVLKVAFLSGMVLELAASISIAIVAVQVGIRLIEGMMTFQPGLFMLFLAPEFYLPFRALGQHHHAGMEGRAAAEDIFRLTDQAQPKNASAGFPLKYSNPLSIQCDNLSYTYPDAANPAIQELSCLVPPGKLTAIVGPSGSGKSTFIALLMGYIQPDNGKVLVNGKLLHDSDLSTWRQQLAYVSQHPHFFNGSIVDNLLLANPDASMELVMEAVRMSHADQFIAGLPEKFQTLLSENASRLSGGEKQRLAMARAFLKNAPLLILDEPTSSLDPESEQYITQATRQAVNGRTTIVVAHRLQTVRMADNILVFSKGRITESGTHDQLTAARGMYYSYLSTLGLTGNTDNE